MCPPDLDNSLSDFSIRIRIWLYPDPDPKIGSEKRFSDPGSVYRILDPFFGTEIPFLLLANPRSPSRLDLNRPNLPRFRSHLGHARSRSRSSPGLEGLKS